MNRSASAEAWVDDDRLEEEPFELSQTRIRPYHAPPADLDEDLALLRPYEEPAEILDEDESFDPDWQRRQFRRVGIKMVGWLGITVAMLGVLRLTLDVPARGAMASWASMGQVRETPPVPGAAAAFERIDRAVNRGN